jgi:hypothetical protein
MEEFIGQNRVVLNVFVWNESKLVEANDFMEKRLQFIG